jgi:hypothetical protein
LWLLPHQEHTCTDSPTNRLIIEYLKENKDAFILVEAVVRLLQFTSCPMSIRGNGPEPGMLKKLGQDGKIHDFVKGSGICASTEI